MRVHPSVKRNVGGADRVLRFVVGITLLTLALVVDMAAGWRLAAFLVGVAAVLTALLRYCPINAALHVDTFPNRLSGP
jgi:hypothetical protein